MISQSKTSIKSKLTPEIAEILGAFIGDGWIEKRKTGFYICGDPIEDKAYYDDFLQPLFSKYFGAIRTKSFKSWKVYGIVSYKKEIITKAIECGFQKGKKCLDVKIPEQIMNSKNKRILRSVVRGIFDTDGSFWCERSRAKTSSKWKRTHNYHPELRIVSCSEHLLNQIKFILDKLEIEGKVVQKTKKGYSHSRNRNNCFALNIRKIDEINKFFKIIGSNNPRHQTRYKVWKKLGYLSPNTTINERIKILEQN